MTSLRGEPPSDTQVAAFRDAAGMSAVFDSARIRAGLEAASVRQVPLSDIGVIVVLQVLDAAMDALDPGDRERVARAFTNRYANEVSHPDAPTLTAKEWGVLRALASGAGTGGAARIANVGVRTVSMHIESLMKKLGASDRTHAVAEAFRRGML